MERQANRLLRKQWADPNELARELVALLTDGSGIAVTSPMTLQVKQNRGPVMTVIQTGSIANNVANPVTYQQPNGLQVAVNNLGIPAKPVDPTKPFKDPSVPAAKPAVVRPRM